jgi:hypothetical protein
MHKAVVLVWQRRILAVAIRTRLEQRLQEALERGTPFDQIEL